MFTIIVLVYFFINTFMSGMFFGKSNEYGLDRKDYIVSALFLVFGVLLIIYVGISYLLEEHLNLEAYFTYWFTDKYDHLDKDSLERLNDDAATERTSNSLGDRSFRYIVKLINKLNNYNGTGK